MAPVQKSTLSGGKPDKNALQMVIHNPNDNVSKASRMGKGLKREGRGLQALTRRTILK